jgi:hypothetical protein
LIADQVMMRDLRRFCHRIYIVCGLANTGHV